MFISCSKLISGQHNEKLYAFIFCSHWFFTGDRNTILSEVFTSDQGRVVKFYKAKKNELTAARKSFLLRGWPEKFWGWNTMFWGWKGWLVTSQTGQSKESLVRVQNTIVGIHWFPRLRVKAYTQQTGSSDEMHRSHRRGNQRCKYKSVLSANSNNSFHNLRDFSRKARGPHQMGQGATCGPGAARWAALC